jgi:hypothetical protein
MSSDRLFSWEWLFDYSIFSISIYPQRFEEVLTKSLPCETISHIMFDCFFAILMLGICLVSHALKILKKLASEIRASTLLDFCLHLFL